MYNKEKHFPEDNTTVSYTHLDVYKRQEPVLTNAIHINGMPLANVHAYSFPAGKHTLMLPKGYLQVLGFTAADMKTRNAGLAGDEETMDWLFY